ncbi:transporter substrate-binding protein [Alteribacillus iranensis]|uniref:Regulatory protein, Fis family n=1 Tax=Alteribacillus iranensis TaxID=930128 RepID=A0A1I2DNU5_9BACI|nr:transporter substrate-binding protein [Alteribacillus iranensis]SFE82205.1 regulatory protein, Fis family [Alteribacillus iranensis]
MEIKVGLLFSLTGTTSITEIGQWKATKYAISKYETQVHSITTFTRDIRSDPAQAAKEAEDLAKAGIKIFVGCYTSACRKAVLPVLEKYDCLLVYPALYEGQECHPNVFYTGEVPNQQVHTLLEYGAQHYGKRVYAIGTDYVYPRETNQQVKLFLKGKEHSLVGERYVPFGFTSFYEIFQEIVEKKPDIIFSTLVGKSVIPFYQMYKQVGLDFNEMPIFSPITKETEVDVMGAEFGEGHYSSASYFQSIPSIENRQFVENFQQFAGRKQPVSSVMFNTYLGTQLVLDSIVRIETEEFREIIYHLSGRKYNTLCGTIVTDPNHRHLSRPVKIGRVTHEGQFETVWDSEKEISPQPFKLNTISERSYHKMVLRNWGKVSEEAVLAVSSEGEIVYQSHQAAKMTNWMEGSFVTKEMLEKMKRSFYIHQYPGKEQNLFVLKPKLPSISSKSPYVFGHVKTVNEEYQSELEVGKIAAESSANVLILGETGTGKEMVAQAIHNMSERKNGPFISVNTGLLPKDLITSELFGYVDGAFTGARKGGSTGKFEAAQNGTIFLDEIGDMPFELQVTLLRAIEDKKIVRVGDTVERPINTRIIAATNRDLEEEIAYENSFRSDLYYRLNVLSITIPPLRERSEDIEHLCFEFLKDFQKAYNYGPGFIKDEALQLILSYPWPGNIRELRNALERAFLIARNEGASIDMKHLPKKVRSFSESKVNKLSLKEVEKRTIEKAVNQTCSAAEAASILGIARSTLYRKMKEYSISM